MAVVKRLSLAKLLCLTSLAFMCLVVNAEAKRRALPFVAVWSSGPYVTKVASVPDELAEFRQLGDNIGWRHERFAVFGLPLWGKIDGSYVIYETTTRGWKAFPVTINLLLENRLITEEQAIKTPPVSMFSITWGWLVIGPVLIIALMMKLLKSTSQQGARGERIQSDRQSRAANTEKSNRSQRIDAKIEALKQERQNVSSSARGSAAHTAVGFGSSTPRFGRR